MSVLSGRRALVTGGSRGIGAAIVRRLAADGAMVGFTYAASGGSADKLRAEVAAQGGTAVAIQADSADAQQVTVAVDEAVAALGGLDILVNNAGMSTSGIAESFPLQDFDRMLEPDSHQPAIRPVGIVAEFMRDGIKARGQQVQRDRRNQVDQDEDHGPRRQPG